MKNFSNDRGFKNFNDRGFGGGNRGRSFGGGNRGGFGRGREERQMFSAICDQCGAECELPFRPTGDKPVYCSDCFDRNGGGNSNKKRFDSRDTKDYSQDNTRAEIEAINQKLDKILSILSSSKETIKVKKTKKVVTPVEETQE